jgi:hypothetical protein
MPNCFTLTRRTDTGVSLSNQAPVPFQTIDEEICEAFGWPVHPVHYVENWYNIIGIQLAFGRTFDQIIADTQDPHIQHIAKWLDEHFVADCWDER